MLADQARGRLMPRVLGVLDQSQLRPPNGPPNAASAPQRESLAAFPLIIAATTFRS